MSKYVKKLMKDDFSLSIIVLIYLLLGFHYLFIDIRIAVIHKKVQL